MNRRYFVILFNLIILIVLFVSAEIFYRWYLVANAEFEWECFEYDKTLGWVPKPGNDDKMVTITPERFRKTEPPGIPENTKTILAIGDSFTFGNHVLDNETWPYYLSEKLNYRVINAGVSGYGLDQIVLRLSLIIDTVQSDLVIISLVYNDIHRCELEKRCQYKPYYDIVNGELSLCNVPVPSPIKPLGPLRWFEKSLIIRKLLLKQTDSWKKQVHKNGLIVAGKLFEYAEKLVSGKGVRLIILFQPNIIPLNPQETLELNKLGEIIRGLEIPLLNLLPVMETEFKGRIKEREKLFVHDGHMSSLGNKWIAAKLADFITLNTANRRNNNGI